jgi:non-ribosomal peptide synthase protein (TIGR01720 family)
MLLEGRQALDPMLVKQAIGNLLIHHDALRLRFVRQGNDWQQQYAAYDEVVPFTYLDLSELPAAIQGQRIESVEAELQGSLRLTEGPLLRVAFFHLGSHRPCHLLLVIHHLVVDGISWRVLLEDLQTAYRQLSQGEAVQLPARTTSFKLWSEQVTAYAQSAALRKELPYWLAEPRTHVDHLPLDYLVEDESNLEGTTRTVSLSMSAEETQTLLLDVPNTYHTQINDVLLTALTLAFSEWTGAKTLLVNMEGHGREDIIEGLDLSHTVGWFTSLFPVLLELEDVSAPGQALKAIKEQLRRIPNHGIGYGLLRYLCKDSAIVRQLQALSPAEVSFNYLGQLDQAYSQTALWRECGESHGPSRSLRGKRSHYLDVGGLIVGGQLHMQWTFSERLHHMTTIEQLAESYMQKLRSIINSCQSPDIEEYTPSDFPLATLDEQKLNALSYLLQQIDEGEKATL